MEPTVSNYLSDVTHFTIKSWVMKFRDGFVEQVWLPYLNLFILIVYWLFHSLQDIVILSLRLNE